MIVEVNDCKCFVALRTNIKIEQKYKKACFQVPSNKRPNAGLDYRKLLIINDEKYIYIQNEVYITGRNGKSFIMITIKV